MVTKKSENKKNLVSKCPTCGILDKKIFTFFSKFMHIKGIENNICKKYSFGFEALLSTANIRCLVQLTWSVNTDMVLMRQKSTNPFFSLA